MHRHYFLVARPALCKNLSFQSIIWLDIPFSDGSSQSSRLCALSSLDGSESLL